MTHPGVRRPERLGFAGTPPFAASILDAVVARYPVEVVYCQPARPSGRGRRLRPCAVETLARARGIAVHAPRSLRGPAAVAELASHDLDLLIVVAYGLLLPPGILEAPRAGCINVHASLLPRWRGAAPIERAIMAGDRETGVCIMQMDAGLDTGPVLYRSECAISDSDTGDSLRERLAALGAEALLTCLSDWQRLSPEPQGASGITYATKLTSDDALIDWRRDADAVARQIRALNSRLPALTWLGAERIRLWFARPASDHGHGAPGQILSFDRKALVVACGKGAIEVTRAQLARGKGLPLDTAALYNGFAKVFRAGQCFTDHPVSTTGELPGA